MEVIEVTKKDEVFLKISCEAGVAQEICDYFTFTVPGHTFMPAYRMKIWDGKIRLFNIHNRLLYGGLLEYVFIFAEPRNYRVAPIGFDWKPRKIAKNQAFLDDLKLPFEPRDYQLDGFHHALSYKKSLLVSPTASGKSLIIYLIVRALNVKTLIIVPTTSLVSQLYSDFQEYGWDSAKYCHQVYAGQDKVSDKLVVISTWQSIYKLNKKTFEPYRLVIGDEAHGFKSKSLTTLMTKCVNAEYRIGTTGTLDGTQTHKLVLEGLFGKVYKVTTTKKLMDRKELSSLNVEIILLKYPDVICEQFKQIKYADEIEFLVGHEKRNKYIRNLVLSLEGNTLLLFRLVKKHGRILYDMIEEKTDDDRKTFFVFGGTETEVREQIRAIAETERDAIIVASYGVFSTGINIRNLHNIVFASPSKSRIRNLQSIGRGLRLSDTTDKTTLYDIADDLRWKNRKNYAYRHHEDRLKIYDEEKFPYKIHNITLKV
ncbi:MAG: DEAD/DEAH box helicase [SAR202 cluster bacterium]|nr:DEAD/DEAH box helicase [SAR202 cluster bacterium]